MAKKNSVSAKSSKSASKKSAGTPRRPRAASTRALQDAPDLGNAPDLGEAPDLPNTGDLAARFMPAAGRPGGMVAFSALVGLSGASGDDVLALARKHLGERYVLGARAPMGNATWRGPWDCAEFVSWCVYQASGVLYGTQPLNDPMLADAYTGYWAQQAQAGGHTISVSEAAGIAGAVVLRRPRQGAIGHIVLSDGQGGTLEAHSSLRGVIAGSLSGRRWDAGILVPGIRYFRAAEPVDLGPVPETLRLTNPLTRGDGVRSLQTRLQALGFAAGTVDGVYGPQTAHAVRQFQASKGLVPDGEVGRITWKALGLD